MVEQGRTDESPYLIYNIRYSHHQRQRKGCTDMSKKLRCYVDIDNLNKKIIREVQHPSTDFFQPTIDKKVGSSRCQNILIKDIRHRQEGQYHKYQHYPHNTHQCPSQDFQVIPKSQRIFQLLNVLILIFFFHISLCKRRGCNSEHPLPSLSY